jgi:hypothetical protein
MYRLREERAIEPETMANLVSSSLYERRFSPYFVSPVIAGINQRTGKPFICGFDSIGCIDFAKDFIVSGTASDQLFGTCESLWEPDLEPEDLFETCSQALLNAVDRDALSGWGAHVYIITKDKVIKRLLKGRFFPSETGEGLFNIKQGDKIRQPIPFATVPSKNEAGNLLLAVGLGGDGRRRDGWDDDGGLDFVAPSNDMLPMKTHVYHSISMGRLIGL